MIPGIVAGTRAASVTPAHDPLWGSVVSLLHFNGADGDITIADQKGVSWTRSGEAVLSTTKKVFGNGSLRLPNTGGLDDFYTTPTLVVESGSPPTELTIEGWIYVESLTGFQYGLNPLIGQGAGSSSSDQFFGLGSGRVNYYIGVNVTGTMLDLVGTTVVAINTWHHIAMTFDGETIRLFLDGALEASAPATLGWINTGYLVRLGREVVSGYETYRFATPGYFDEVRITRACRYTESFTPAGPFPNSGT